jgi:hypothetical protein
VFFRTGTKKHSHNCGAQVKGILAASSTLLCARHRIQMCESLSFFNTSDPYFVKTIEDTDPACSMFRLILRTPCALR